MSIEELEKRVRALENPAVSFGATFRCSFWDCGWCYNKDGPKYGCVGLLKEGCPLRREGEK